MEIKFLNSESKMSDFRNKYLYNVLDPKAEGKRRNGSNQRGEIKSKTPID